MSLDPVRAWEEAPRFQPAPPHPCQEMMSQRHNATAKLVGCLKRNLFFFKNWSTASRRAFPIGGARIEFKHLFWFHRGRLLGES
ncbi:hypothetical protein P5673_016692 [Acropora cervicornis]|uniref:Uncharacterized protein n=1 Tax=Acropora cervicornis TaxID=6130 RepID=A0AAD9V424_ACRCE|nr:hypothetical protein P5673_016692 [Acropora cervicornis]